MAVKTQKEIPTPKAVKYGSAEHEAILAGAYGFSKAEATAIIKERKENPLTHPYEVAQKAEAMLAALKEKPKAVSDKQGWSRDRSTVNMGY